MPVLKPVEVSEADFMLMVIRRVLPDPEDPSPTALALVAACDRSDNDMLIRAVQDYTLEVARATIEVNNELVTAALEIEDME